mgnify:CR=1 FL=1
MSVELSIFKVFCEDREKHLLHKGHIDGLDNLEKELKTLFKLMTLNYDEYADQNSVSTETLLNYYELKYPKSKAKEYIVTVVINAMEMELIG